MKKRVVKKSHLLKANDKKDKIINRIFIQYKHFNRTYLTSAEVKYNKTKTYYYVCPKCNRGFEYLQLKNGELCCYICYFNNLEYNEYAPNRIFDKAEMFPQQGIEMAKNLWRLAELNPQVNLGEEKKEIIQRLVGYLNIGKNYPDLSGLDRLYVKLKK